MTTLANLVKPRRVKLPNGETAVIKIPKAKDAIAIREYAAQIGQNLAADPAKAAGEVLNLHARAVQICVDEKLSEDVAIAVVLETDGETGALATAAMKACGLSRLSRSLHQAYRVKEEDDEADEPDAEEPPEADVPT